MNYAILHYLYRDAANWKTFGAVAFPNPDEKTVDEITAAIRATLEGGEFFIAESVDMPTLYHDASDPNWADQAHGYHEFEQVELVYKPRSGIKRDERTITELLEAFRVESEKGWGIVRNLEAEKPDESEGNLYIRLFHGRENMDDKLEDWGWDGPILGPYESIQLTYGTHIKLHKADHFEDLGVAKDLICYDGYYYGDMEIFESDSPPDGTEAYAYWKAHGNYTREHVLEIARDYGCLSTEAAIAEILDGEYLDETYHPHRENHPFVKKALASLDKLKEIDIATTPEAELKAMRGYLAVVAENIGQAEEDEGDEYFWELDLASVFDALEEATALHQVLGVEVRCFCVIPGARYPCDFEYMKENYTTVFTLPATRPVATHSEKEQTQ